MKQKGFIDDKMFAESYVRSEVVKKGKPALLLKKKLEQKGIDRKLLDEIFHAHEADMEEGILERIKKEIAAYKKKDVE
jgi:SOS response regulatory protein OraA/RecX